VAGRLRGLPRTILQSKIDEFLYLFSLWEDRHCPLLALALAFARLVASVIWGVSATDRSTFIPILLAHILAIGIAVYIPAHKALKIDPMLL
jgi:hypothetical protein